jgi:hypothetical protein
MVGRQSLKLLGPTLRNREVIPGQILRAQTARRYIWPIIAASGTAVLQGWGIISQPP